MTPPWPENLVAVAEILRPQGNRGQVKAALLTKSPERLGDLRTLTAWRDGSGRTLTLTAWRMQGEYAVLDFAESKSITEAEELRGALVCVKAAERAPLPPDSYYHDDLIGLAVEDGQGARLGTVRSVMTTGANDVLVVALAGGGELLVPAVKAAIREVDLSGGRIVIDARAGVMG
ncbi:MAG: ribosome maturation factor RimM [Patescibacteria group bacterium]